jgi:predicted nucleic-acid-binding Zn-ribbon protein
MAEPREQLATALNQFLTPEQLTKLIDEVLSVTKKAHATFNCKKCGAQQYQYGEINDAKAVASALTDLLTQAYGRPGEEVNQGEPIVFIRVSTMAEAEKIVGAKPDPKPGASKAKPGRPRKTVGRQKQTPVGGV